MTRIICFWEAPRSRGTSISFAFYNGLRAAGYHCAYRDEPLHWRRLKAVEDEQGVDAKNAYIEEVKTPQTVAGDFLVQKEQAKWVFDTTTGSKIGDDLEWIRGYTNVILFRDAAEMVVSHHKKLEIENRGSLLNFEMVGAAQLFKIFQFLEGSGQPVVVDTNELLQNPAAGMRKLCDRLEVPYSAGMVRWEKPDILPPPWGRHWYDDIMKSDGLHPYRPSATDIPEGLVGLVDRTASTFSQLRSARMRFG